MSGEKSDRGSIESCIVALKRISEKRLNEANTVNRGEQVKLSSECHEYAKKHRLFSMHLSSERSVSQQALKELVAHRHVLAAIAASNAHAPDYDGRYGRYGAGAFRAALQSKIEAEKLRMEPMQRRKTMCKLLLDHRRKAKEDVTKHDVTKHGVSKHGVSKSQPEVQSTWGKTGPNDASNQQGLHKYGVSESQHHTGKLIVPPIHATKQHLEDSPRKAGERNAWMEERTMPERTSALTTRNSLSTVFITQRGITKI